MITNFGALYAGHVDLGDIGLEATALNDRNFSDEHLATMDEATAKDGMDPADLDETLVTPIPLPPNEGGYGSWLFVAVWEGRGLP